MLLGHYAVALAGKSATPRTSLGILLVAAQLPDLLFPLLILLGLEHVRIAPGITVVFPMDLYDYPLSHSLLAGLLWSTALASAFYVMQKEKRGALIVGLAVLSHWILDLITHRPDLSLGFGTGTYVGLGLWNSLYGTLIAESAVFIFGVALYVRTTKAIDRIGSIGFWSWIGFLVAMYAGSFFGSDSSIDTLATVLLMAFSWAVILWGHWTDKHRHMTEPAQSA
jgi:FtsH-binding integral membrane protein